MVVANLDNLEPAIPSAFWNAHAGNGLVFVTDEDVPETTWRILQHGPMAPGFTSSTRSVGCKRAYIREHHPAILSNFLAAPPGRGRA